MIPYLPAKILRRKAKLQFQGPVRQLLQGPLRSWLDRYPDLSRQAPEVLATGSYARINDLGHGRTRCKPMRIGPACAFSRPAWPAGKQVFPRLHMLVQA